MPEVPVMVIVAEPAAALGSAVRVTFCETPGARFRVDGFAVTPPGRPLSFTLTVSPNPLFASAVIVTDCPVDPAVRAIVEDERLSAKSGCCSFVVDLGAESLPHATSKIASVQASQQTNSLLHRAVWAMLPPRIS